MQACYCVYPLPDAVSGETPRKTGARRPTITTSEYEQILRNATPALEAINERYSKLINSVKLGCLYRYGVSAYETWRYRALREMHDVLFAQYTNARNLETNEQMDRTAARLPSHSQMARVRAARLRNLQSRTDPLENRKSGWVLAKQEAKRAALIKAKQSAERKSLAKAFMPYYNRADFRQAVASRWVDDAGHSTSVYVAEHHDRAPGVHSVANVVWDNKGKGRSGTASAHQFWLARNWPKRVAAKGIALIDGLLTLDAAPIKSKLPCATVEAYEAKWCGQSRGTYLYEGAGVILRLSPNDPWVHGPTIEGAYRVAKRRASDRRVNRQVMRDQAIESGDWSSVWPDLDLDAIQVCIKDSLSVGNCKPGTYAWVARHLPEYVDVDCAPATVVLAAAAKDNTSTRRLAVAAVHRAVLRSRKAAA